MMDFPVIHHNLTIFMNRKFFFFSLFLIITLTSAMQQSSDKPAMQMINTTTDSTEIANVLTDIYFRGIYEGDVNLLSTAYYSGTLLLEMPAGNLISKLLPNTSMV